MLKNPVINATLIVVMARVNTSVSTGRDEN